MFLLQIKVYDSRYDAPVTAAEGYRVPHVLAWECHADPDLHSLPSHQDSLPEMRPVDGTDPDRTGRPAQFRTAHLRLRAVRDRRKLSDGDPADRRRRIVPHQREQRVRS